MVIYADVVFAVNFVSSYIMLYILGKVINRVKIRKKRLIAASVIGGIFAAVVFCTEIPVYFSYIIRIASVCLMIIISFFEQRKCVAAQLAWFTVMTCVMVFSMLALASVLKNAVGAVIKAGIVYIDIPLNIFIPAFILSYAIMILLVKAFKNRQNKRYYIMSVTHNDKTVTVTALFDSGNLLKEPITGKEVSLLEWDEAKKLFCAEYDFDDIEKHIEEMKLWVIPFHSVDNPSGILFAFLADGVVIEDAKKDVGRTFIGIYGGRLSKNEEYHALINAGLL